MTTELAKAIGLICVGAVGITCLRISGRLANAMVLLLAFWLLIIILGSEYSATSIHLSTTAFFAAVFLFCLADLAFSIVLSRRRSPGNREDSQVVDGH